MQGTNNHDLEEINIKEYIDVPFSRVISSNDALKQMN